MTDQDAVQGTFGTSDLPKVPFTAPAVYSPLTPHNAVRTTLDGRYGPVAALHATARTPRIATALLVPGYTGSKEDFSPLFDACADAGFDTIAIDLPGQFESPGPADEDAYLPSVLGGFLAELISALDSVSGPVLLLGHSYGGLVARSAVLAGAPIAGLTLLASGPGALPDGPRIEALAHGEPLLRRDGTIAAYQVREAMNAHEPGWSDVPAETKDFLRRRFVQSTSACLLGMATGLRTEPDKVDELVAALDAAALPRLVVTGEHDDAWSVPEQRTMAQRLDAEFVLVPGAAHSPNTENPLALLATLLPAWRSWLGVA